MEREREQKTRTEIVCICPIYDTPKRKIIWNLQLSYEWNIRVEKRFSNTGVYVAFTYLYIALSVRLLDNDYEECVKFSRIE